MLIHAHGRFSGLRQILGTDEGMPFLPPEVEGVQFLDGRTGSCSLLTVKPKYALYKEMPSPVKSGAGV